MENGGNEKCLQRHLLSTFLYHLIEENAKSKKKWSPVQAARNVDMEKCFILVEKSISAHEYFKQVNRGNVVSSSTSER